MRRRLGTWFTLFGTMGVLVACIDGKDTVVGEVDRPGDFFTGGGGNGSGGTDFTTGGGGSTGTSGTGTGGIGADCEPGTVLPLEDGCNRCTCNERRQFICTNTECAECMPPAGPNIPCLWRYIREPQTKRCCYYPDACPPIVDDGAYETFEECMAAPPEYGRYADCDGDRATGLETSVMTSLHHCGGCGYECAPERDGSSVDLCISGLCVHAVCEGGYSNCNDSAEDGCEWFGPCDNL